MKVLSFSITLFACLFFVSCSSTNTKQEGTNPAAVKTKMVNSEDLRSASRAYFASGCFWCVEAIYESVQGVSEAVSGYSGGVVKNPTYQQIGTGQLKHAEAVEVFYDPKVVSFETLVKVFFGSHDPTSYHRQGPDRGPQYRSIAFYQSEEEKKIIEKYIDQINESGAYSEKVVTEVVPFEKFWIAEDYHQDYERLNPNNPYVQQVSIPRLNRFKAKFPELLKKDH